MREFIVEVDEVIKDNFFFFRKLKEERKKLKRK